MSAIEGIAVVVGGICCLSFVALAILVFIVWGPDKGEDDED